MRSRTREKIEISIPDMNCASCVAKDEKTLNQIEGAEATVNFATWKVKKTWRRFTSASQPPRVTPGP